MIRAKRTQIRLSVQPPASRGAGPAIRRAGGVARQERVGQAMVVALPVWQRALAPARAHQDAPPHAARWRSERKIASVRSNDRLRAATG